MNGLVATVAAAGLDPAALVEHAPLPDGDRVWALRSTSEGWFDDWKALRGILPETGRWPLAMTSWGVEIDPINRQDATAILSRLEDVDVGAAIDRLEEESLPMPLDEWFEYHEDATRQRCGRAPTLGELEAALGDEPLEMEIERWLLRWEYPFRELRPALFRRWSEQYGAEPAANWDTMMQLVVTHPPSTIEDAFELARAMTLLWPNTNSGPGITVREMAFDLIGRQTWFLHCRP